MSIAKALLTGAFVLVVLSGLADSIRSYFLMQKLSTIFLLIATPIESNKLLEVLEAPTTTTEQKTKLISTVLQGNRDSMIALREELIKLAQISKSQFLSDAVKWVSASVPFLCMVILARRRASALSEKPKP